MTSEDLSIFITNDERKGTCYHEFAKGKWDEETVWRDDSIYLHDDDLQDCEIFYKALREAVPNYDRYGVAELNRQEWDKVGDIVLKSTDFHSVKLYLEANKWVQENFKDNEVFSILGI